MIFEDNYIYFVKALKYVINEKGHGCQKVIAADAGISDSLISMALNPNIKNKPGFVAQQKIANAAGYSYVSFLELGRSLAECGKPTESKSTDSIPKLNNVHFLPVRKSQEELRRQAMHERLETIYNSGHTVLISAIESNLVAFSEAVEDKKERNAMLERIKTLEKRG